MNPLLAEQERENRDRGRSTINPSWAEWDQRKEQIALDAGCSPEEVAAYASGAWKPQVTRKPITPLLIADDSTEAVA